MVAFCVLSSAAAAAGADGLESLRVLGEDYPLAFFFRSSEGAAANGAVTYDRWEAAFSRLMGIEGKVLDEEVPGRSQRNVDFFTRFKKEHPEQLVLLHYNGNARDPRYQTEKYFAGHWIYHNGAKILEGVPAEAGETEIKVDDPSLFRTQMGRYRTSNDDVGLSMLDAAGRPDWQRSEQVQLVAVDPKRKVIRVRRGCYGTEPMAFPAHSAYAAAHAVEGPWGGESNLMWFYNHSTRCPRDRNGRTCADVHSEELAARFLPGGELEAFDGLEFDVLHHELGGRNPKFGYDCDADGRIDNGRFDGVGGYGIGVVEFCRRLRERLGPKRLILADGMGLRNQRAFRILNGIESEGWPTLSDWEVRDWSGGMNRHFFWRQNAAQPVLNYINHKYTAAGERPGSRVRPQLPFAVHRLVFAVATFTDSAVCYSFTPPAARGELIGIWDELRKGRENQLGWLGRPLGPPVRLAESQPDLLAGRGDPIQPALAGQFADEGTDFALDEGLLKITSSEAEADRTRFRLRGVPCDGPDLFVSLTARGRPRRGYPTEIARRMWVGIAAPEGRLTRSELPQTGMCIRGEEETAIVADSGASVRWAPAENLAGEKHDCYRVHPPYRQGVGYTFWQREVQVPEGGYLALLTGMGEKSPQRSDGVTFHVLVGGVREGRPPEFRQVFEHSQKAFQWVAHRVPLADWASRRVWLKFVSDCGPNDNSTTDHAHWGDVALVDPENDQAPTTPVRYMTWLDDRDFTSGFYFSDVRSKRVDLEWDVEGAEPVWIKSVRAHAHPDAVYREFEHGLVLANPSPRPYVVDLERLFAGQRFRRLQGSPEQDPVANDGSPVAGKLTLGPKEGLFLVREPAAGK